MIKVLKKNEEAFSIVELMIVVTIIGVLATVSIMKMRDYQASNRDSIRKMHLTQIYKALQIYYAQHKKYPASANKTLTSGYTEGYKDYVGDTSYIPGLAPKYINELPEDPFDDKRSEPNGCEFCGYRYYSNERGFQLEAVGVLGKIGGVEAVREVGKPFKSFSLIFGDDTFMYMRLCGGTMVGSCE